MRTTVARFWCPKRGSMTHEYEDALARWTRGAPPYRFAVADGASESSFARQWARLLVAGYVRGAVAADTLAADLASLQACWQGQVGAAPRPWYVLEKVRAGAFAALAGLTLEADGRWRALAVGDCCILHLRAGALLQSFPLASAEQFDHRPLLISSNPARNHCLREAVRSADGTWVGGDRFLLLSDALAASVLRRVADDGGCVSGTLDFERSRCGFRTWVEALRADGALRNDDVSLMIVQVV